MVAVKGNSLEEYFFGGTAFTTIALIFFLRKCCFLFAENISVEVGESDKYFAAATAKAKIWRGPFAVSGFSAFKRL